MSPKTRFLPDLFSATDKEGALTVVKSDNYAKIALIAALVILSFTPLLIKMSISEVSLNATIFNRLWIASVVLLLWESISRAAHQQVFKPLHIHQDPLNRSQNTIPVVKTAEDKYRTSALLILIALVSTASLACWAWSLTQTSVANSTVLRNLTPIFTSLGGWLFLRIKFDLKFLSGLALALLGAVAIGWDDFQLGSDSFQGDGIALFSAFLYAIYLMGVESLRNSLDTITILLWRCGFGALFIFPVMLFTGETLFPESEKGWIIVILLAVVCQVIGQGLLIYSLKQFSSGLIAIFLLLQPLIAAMLAWVMFAESLTFLNGLAFFLILGGIYLAQSSNLATNN